MLTVTERVWRHLCVAAQRDSRRRWPSVSALGRELDLATSTVHRALSRPAEIQAVRILPGGGLITLDPGRLLMLWAARRRPVLDLVDRFSVPVRADVVERAVMNPDAILGGFAAVTAALGANTIADYSTVLVYGDPRLPPLGTDANAGSPGFEDTTVWVLEPDPLLARYGRNTPLAQAWVDLFNIPGWQAARFVHALLPRVVVNDAA